MCQQPRHSQEERAGDQVHGEGAEPEQEGDDAPQNELQQRTSRKGALRLADGWQQSESPPYQALGLNTLSNRSLNDRGGSMSV